MPKVYTVEEVADMLRIHETVVRKLIRDGELKAFKIQRRWRIYEDDLKAFIDKQSNM